MPTQSQPAERIKDYFTLTGDYAIFNALQDYAVPWQEEDIAASLDLLYLGHSGDKCISPVIKLFATDDVLSTDNFAQLIRAVYAQYNKQWQRYWDVFQAEYTALNNYDLTENETIDDSTTGTESGSNTDTKETSETGKVTDSGIQSETGSQTDSGTQSETGETTDSGTTSDTETIESSAESTASSEGTDDKGIYGFASTKQTSSDTNNTTADSSSNTTGSSTTTKSGTSGNTQNVTKSGTTSNEQTTTKSGTTSNEQNTTKTGTDSTTGTYSKDTTGTGKRTRELTRSGNIGIRSNQELLQQEIDLWKWNYFEQVFQDIDKVFTLRVY